LFAIVGSQEVLVLSDGIGLFLNKISLLLVIVLVGAEGEFNQVLSDIFVFDLLHVGTEVRLSRLLADRDTFDIGDDVEDFFSESASEKRSNCKYFQSKLIPK